MNNDKIVKDTKSEIDKITSELENKDSNKNLTEDEMKEYKNRILRSFLNSAKKNNPLLNNTEDNGKA